MKQIKQTHKSYKSAEMSMTVVVGAIIALVILIVLIYIFTKQAGTSSKTFASCGLNGGVCSDSTSCTNGGQPLDGIKCGDNACCSRADWLCGAKGSNPKTGQCNP